MPDHPPSPERLAAVVAALERLDPGPTGHEIATLRATALRTLRDHLLPRVSRPDDDLVVAVVGVSGSGKSTLVNSLAKRRVTETGTIRPTTTEPVAWGGATLPGTLDALRRRLPGRMVDTLRPPPAGVAIVDTPPPEVVDRHGEGVAAQVLAVADACILVAAANRYADAAGFALAADAAARGLPTVFVLNRLPPTPELQRVLVEDYAGKLAARGLIDRAGPEGIVAIAEGPVSSDRSGLATDAVMGLRKEVERLGDPENRAVAMRQVLARSTALVARHLSALRRALIEAEAHRASLIDPVTISYAGAAESLAGMVAGGAFADLKDDPDRLADAIAAAASRRSGQAAIRAAEHWEGATDRIAADLFAHGGDTPEVARERLRWWAADLPRLATESTGRAVPRRRVDRLTGTVRRAVLDPDHLPVRRERRLLERYPGIVEAAAERLAEELAGIVAVDATRFTASLGTGAVWGTLADLTLEAE